MDEIVKRYSNGETTVAWRPSRCVHSAKCFTGLPGVFDPRGRPWVRMDAASTAEIERQVGLCPSGALSLEKPGATMPATADSDETVVEMAPAGPLLVRGELVTILEDGTRKKSGPVTAYCRCGHSANRPFCDGSHRKAGFKG